MITGTIMNYYFHCKRQCYLFYNRMNLEDNSEDVRIGKVLHELKEEKDLSFENIKLDKITAQYIVEFKKSDADIEAAKMQLLYYLYKLKNKGVIRKGRLECEELNKQTKKLHIIELDTENEERLLRLMDEIGTFLVTENIPGVLNDKKCKKCAYYDYCYI